MSTDLYAESIGSLWEIIIQSSKGPEIEEIAQIVGTKRIKENEVGAYV